jgi:hypothetical protein
MLRPPTDPSAISKCRERRRSRAARVLFGAWELLAATVFLLVVTGQAAFADVTVTPTAPPGVDGLQDLLNWTMYGGALACTGTMIYGFAKMGLSHQNQSYSGANHGKAVAMLGLVGALGLGLTPTIVNGLTAIH